VERAVWPARQRAHSEVAKILDSAWDVLAETDWADLKLGMVLEQAHVSTRNFYRNFSSKSSLLVALFEEEISTFAAQLTRKMAESDDPADKVNTWIALNLKRAYNPNSQARTRLFAAEGPALAPEFPEDVYRIRKMIIDPLALAIREGIESGSFKLVSADESAIAIWLLTSSLMRDPSCTGMAEKSYEGSSAFVIDIAARILSRQ